MRKISVDTKCYDLAALFLSDCDNYTEEDIWVADSIQLACEEKCAEVDQRS